jgi:hypothetical protein
VTVAHVPRDPIQRVEHRLGVLDRARDLRWNHLVYGLEADVAKAAPSLTRAQREALVDWLRWEEWFLRQCGDGGRVEARALSGCRTHLGDGEPVTADVAHHDASFHASSTFSGSRTRQNRMAAPATEPAS